MNSNYIKKYTFGISTTADYSIPILEQLKIFSESGFDFISIGANHEHAKFDLEDDFRQVLNTANDLGLSVDSIHARFYQEYNLASIDKKVRTRAIDLQKRFITRCHRFGLDRIIFHPHYYLETDRETTLKLAADSLRELIDFKPKQTVLIVENLPTADGSWLCENLIDIFDDTRIGFCFDSSHENMSGKPFHLLKKNYSRLTTTHLSDNHGESDEHLVPGDGNIDWDALKQFIDKSPISAILFEVGTGEPLGEGLKSFSDRAFTQAKSIFEQ